MRLCVRSECREMWQTVIDARFSGGTRSTGVTSATDCLDRCIANTDCLAADYHGGNNECWIHTNAADLTQTNTATGYRQYLLTRRCEDGQQHFCPLTQLIIIAPYVVQGGILSLLFLCCALDDILLMFLEWCMN